MRSTVRTFLAVCLTLPFALSMPAAAEADSPCSTVLMEAQTGMVLQAELADAVLPAGSLTKLMTVYLCAEAVAAHRLRLDEAVTVPSAAEGTPGATVWLKQGEQMSAEDLLKAVIIGNANDAAVTLAVRLAGSEEDFIPDMNSAAFTLGMRQTCFADCTGLSDENRTSAQDIALLSRALLTYEFLRPYFTTWRDLLRDGATELVSENRLTYDYEGLLGLKAGHGDGCGYTLALAAERGGMQCIAVVMGCADKNERFSIGKSLLREGFTGYYVTTPDFSAEFLQPAQVHHGTAAAVLTEATALRAIAAPKGQEISCVVCLPQYTEAPVTQGQTLGSLAFYCADTLLYETSLTAAEAVPRRGLRESLSMLLGNLFK